MMKLLISGAHIWSAQQQPFLVEEAAVAAVDGIYPLSVLGEYSIVEVETPEGFTADRYTWDAEAGAVVAKPQPEVPLAPAAPRHITKLAFDNRFHQAELVALDLASIDDPAATEQQRLVAASLRVHQRKVDRAAYIDLDRDDTRGGVELLEWFGLLAVGRAAEILDAPVQELERPH
jgi:hypothetical protein